MLRKMSWLVVAAGFGLLLPAGLDAQGFCGPPQVGKVAEVHFRPGAVSWEPLVEYDQLILRIDTPCSTVEKVFGRGEQPFFELGGDPSGLDGTYVWELRVVPVVEPWVRGVLEEARRLGDSLAACKLSADGYLPAGPMVQGASFTVADDSIVSPEGVEEVRAEEKDGNRLVTKDVLHYDDVIVTGSLCVGFDCVNGESFGYDTVKLKENNLRLYFEDTSVGSFPTGDWRIKINDTTSGGASYFAVEDATNARTPFRIETGAPNHALYVEDYGRVGLGTSIPYVELHIVDGDTPTVRLDQDGSSGWAAQAWDLAGNETNFFVRDVTNGSKLPFRIQPSTPSNTLTLKSDGKVGIGTWSPGGDGLEIVNDGSSAQRILLRLKNNGAPQSEYENSGNGIVWRFGQNTSGDFVINDTGDLGTAEMRITTGGTVYVNGGQVHPDYVFKPEYELMPLAELESFVREHQHLPNVQSASDRERDGGVNITELPLQLLEKVEELTLYTLGQQKRIVELTKQLDELRSARR